MQRQNTQKQLDKSSHFPALSWPRLGMELGLEVTQRGPLLTSPGPPSAWDGTPAGQGPRDRPQRYRVRMTNTQTGKILLR